MKTIFYLAVLLSTASQCSAQCWNLVWADEFNGSNLDATKWTPQTGGGGWGNNELQYYTARPENIEVSNGSLKIIARSETYSGSNYTSARLRSINKGDWTYGKFEARIKMPAAQGLWPAFWMMPTENYYGTHPRSGELDIMELFGLYPSRVYGTIHTINTATNGVFSSSAQYNMSVGNFGTDFHIFSVEWKPDTIRWYVDNILFSTKTSANFNGNPWRFDRDFHILLNLAVGGDSNGAPNASTLFPATMEVDYVRAYQRNEDIKILGSALIEPNTEGSVYSLPQMSGVTYNWSVPTDATIISGQNTAQISVSWGNTSGNVACEINTACGITLLEKAVEVSGNIIKNPSFEDDYFRWGKTAQNGAAANFNIINSPTAPDGSKYACIQTTALGIYDWHVQITQQNMNISGNVLYTARFKAKADAAGKVIRCAVIHATNFTSYANQLFTLGTDWQEYTINFTPSANAPISFNFDCGFNVGEFCFDNAILSKTSNMSYILPVELIDFQAFKLKNTVKLKWQISNEQGVVKYEIEHSSDGINFEKIGDLKPNNSIEYAFETPLLPSIKTMYFRLKIIDSDRMVSFSKIQSIENEEIPIKIYPNPAKETLNIDTPKPMRRVWLTDLVGRIFYPVLSPKNELILRGLPIGIYQLHILDSNNQMTVLRFVKE